MSEQELTELKTGIEPMFFRILGPDAVDGALVVATGFLRFALPEDIGRAEKTESGPGLNRKIAWRNE